MTIDILFPTFNRLEFTRESLAALLANTNWDLVRNVYFADDRSTDGTRDLVARYCDEIGLWNWSAKRECAKPFTFDPAEGRRWGSPAELMNQYVKATRLDSADYFAKIDSDVIVPPGWLDKCAGVMAAHPNLDLLGIEPPASRTPHFEGMKRSPAPELDPKYAGQLYASCDSIGGVGLMRTATFRHFPDMQPSGTYSGFTEFQLRHSNIEKGWINPPLKCFLLDRLPFSPWTDLSRKYESLSWQRPWSKYPISARTDLWGWWNDDRPF